MASCYNCGANLDAYLISKVSRQDSCLKCGRDLRTCKNCSFYDPNAHWECKETVSDHVLDKEKANFCDHFKLNPSGSSSASSGKSKEDILSAAEALFKKK